MHWAICDLQVFAFLSQLKSVKTDLTTFFRKPK